MAELAYDLNNRLVWDGSYFTFYGRDGRRMGRYTKVLAGDNYTWKFAVDRTMVYFGGKLIGQGEGSTAATTFQPILTDRLGSVRVRGSVAMSYYPYGQERTATANAQEKFGTYLRRLDGIDYADQRWFTSIHGRFLTVDPYGGSAEAGNPGSWNRFAYVEGDPVNYGDPEGLSGEAVDPCSGSMLTSAGAGYVPTGCSTRSQIYGQGNAIGIPDESGSLIGSMSADMLGGYAFYSAGAGSSQYDASHVEVRDRRKI